MLMTSILPDLDLAILTPRERDVVVAAVELGNLEQQLAEEYIRLTITGQPTWAAQKAAEIRFIQDIRIKQAQYAIAVSRLNQQRSL